MAQLIRKNHSGTPRFLYLNIHESSLLWLVLWVVLIGGKTLLKILVFGTSWCFITLCVFKGHIEYFWGLEYSALLIDTRRCWGTAVGWIGMRKLDENFVYLWIWTPSNYFRETRATHSLSFTDVSYYVATLLPPTAYGRETLLELGD